MFKKYSDFKNKYKQKTINCAKNRRTGFRWAVVVLMILFIWSILSISNESGHGSVEAAGSKTSEAQLLARAINGEARGESYKGQVAVGAVILNRTRDSRFPKTIAGVIYQPGAFTAVSDGQINAAVDSKSTILKAARDALNGWDPTNGCVYYWNPATATSKWIWSLKIVMKIGKHNFAK
ncbi:MAG: cell wall hydrolase [Clostridiales bacterium]|nr:cell wall hydrolase [Clostridiales bacterium]